MYSTRGEAARIPRAYIPYKLVDLYRATSTLGCKFRYLFAEEIALLSPLCTLYVGIEMYA